MFHFETNTVTTDSIFGGFIAALNKKIPSHGAAPLFSSASPTPRFIDGPENPCPSPSSAPTPNEIFTQLSTHFQERPIKLPTRSAKLPNLLYLEEILPPCNCPSRLEPPDRPLQEHMHNILLLLGRVCRSESGSEIDQFRNLRSSTTMRCDNFLISLALASRTDGVVTPLEVLHVETAT